MPPYLARHYIEGRITHTVFTTKGSNRCARLRLLQDGHDLAVSKFRCFHPESPACILRENSTFKSYYFREDYPVASITGDIQINVFYV